MENEEDGQAQDNTEEENPESGTPGGGQSGKGGAGSKKPPKKKERGRRNREICDVFGEAAMINAYYICHNVQDFLNCRGFPWNPGKK